MKTKIVQASDLTTNNLTAHNYIPDAFYRPDRKITFRLRDSNSVLEEEHWPIISVTLEHERIMRLQILHLGAWGIDRFRLGGTIADVLDWLRYDSTGEHPEHYHEIYNPVDKTWQTVDDMGDLVEALSRSYRHGHRGGYR